MSVTRLLDHFASSGRRLGASTADEYQLAMTFVLPVWNWLNEAARRASELDVEWLLLDEAVSEATTDEIVRALSQVEEAASDQDAVALAERLAQLHVVVEAALGEAANRLRAEGIEEQTVASLFLPLRRELTAFAVSQESSEVLGRARHALSEVGGKKLALSFEEQFVSDKRQADRWRQVAFALFALALVWSITVYVALRGSDASTADVTARLAVGVSFFALGGVAIRESGRHRADANVWRTVQLQLNTIDAYCSALPRERADSLRFMLGAAVFSGPQLYTSAVGTPSAEDSAEGTPVATRAVEASPAAASQPSRGAPA